MATRARNRKPRKTALAAVRVSRREPGADGLAHAYSQVLARQAATAEILKVVARSPSDVQPVFETIARAAHKLCNARYAVVTRRVGDMLHLVAHTARKGVGHLEKLFPTKLTGRGATGKAVLTREPAWISDVETDPGYSDDFRAGARERGYRSQLTVPILRKGQSIGAITVTRPQAGEFDRQEIELLQTFADQAAIAIENTRLFNETKQALERQTATAEILNVIARSPSDVQPVFDAIAHSAVRLCGGLFGFVSRFDGEKVHLAAQHNFPPAALEIAKRAYPSVPDRSRGAGRAILTKSVVRIEDISRDPDYLKEYGKKGGWRRVLAVPMMRDGVPLGTISVAWSDPGPIPDSQVELLKTFADQALIAIDNVRHFNETKEALEQQTATAEVLRVISSTPTDTQPVFEAIVQSTHRLMSGRSASLLLRQDPHFVIAASSSPEIRNAPSEVRTAPLDRDKNFPSRVILDGELVHIPDWTADDVPAHEKVVATTLGLGSGVQVPLLRNGKGIGALVVAREAKGRFHEKEIALLRSFADQAVIAIENLRLFTELQTRNKDLTEALEQQTATGEILKVISSSPTDVQPVFDTIIRNAVRLGNASFGFLMIYDGRLVDLAAMYNVQPGIEEIYRPTFPRPVSRNTFTGHAIMDRRVINLGEIAASDYGQGSKDRARLAGFRSVLVVPMLRGGEPIGAIAINKREPGAFSDSYVALLKTFADQAVIAIENVRLFKALEERNRALTVALEQQTATGEILKVLSSSPTDVQPVFDTIIRNGVALCAGTGGALFIRDGQMMDVVAVETDDADLADDFRRSYPQPIHIAVPAGQAMLERRVCNVGNVLEGDHAEMLKQRARMQGFRSVLAVPMLRGGEAIGAITVASPNTQPFPESAVALLQTFADQAVIAIENVRLFNETKDALERQSASAEVLRVISRTPNDAQPVFRAIAESAVRVFGAFHSGVALVEGDNVRGVATAGAPDPRGGFVIPLDRNSTAGSAILDRAVFSVADSEAPDTVPFARDSGRAVGFRAIASAPMLRNAVGIGVVTVMRRDPGAFSDKQLELLQTFADQAVIAIENARLFNETKEALERQTATAEILNVISRSPTDVRPVFDTIVRSAIRLLDGRSGGLFTSDGMQVHVGAAFLGEEDRTAAFQQDYPAPIEYRVPSIIAISQCRVMNVPDILGGDWPAAAKERARNAGYRASLAVPMQRGGKAIGSIVVTRADPGLFADHHVTLLKTFADQAVIAIENVRLFKELQARTEALTKSVGQLTALGDVARAIGSTLDLETVLKTIVSRALQLTGLDSGSIYEYDQHAEEFRLRAGEGMSAETVAILRSQPIRKGEGTVGATAVRREPVQVADIQAEGYDARLREILVRAGRRAVLAVPLLHEERIIGALAVQKDTAGPFAPEVVELLTTFATQSAMAIQNARLYREIEQKGKELEVASRHKSQFLASMSHELRTPLNAILGFNEMLLGEVYGPVPADMHEPLKDIQTSGKHLLRLINNVLDLAKIEAGHMELALADYSVQDTVAGVHATLRPLAAEKGLDFITDVPADIPLARGDAGRLTQCLMNLAGNSLKFTKQGCVAIGVEHAGGALRYSVTDTGIGIPPDKIASLFTEFKQTDATIASEFGGTGLGLSITKKFIEMHGGRIWVQSELGRGSAFRFEIPLRVAG